MSENWSPGSPDSLGVAWQPVVEVNPLVAANVVAVLESSVTESIGSAFLYFLALEGDGGRYELEVWDLEALNLQTFDVLTDIYNPAGDEDNTRAQKWDGAAFSGVALWQALDDSTTTEWVQGTDVAQSFNASFSFDNANNAYTGKQVVALRLRGYVTISATQGAAVSLTITPYLNLDGQRYEGDTVTFSEDTEGPQLVEFIWRANPATGQTWTPDMVDEFRSAGGQPAGVNSAGWQVEPTGRNDAEPRIVYGRLDVFYLDSELREAISGDTIGINELGWVGFDLFDPVSGNDWAKQAGVTYVFILTKWAGDGSRAVRYLDSRLGPVSSFRTAPPQVPSRLGTPPAGPPFWTSGVVLQRPNNSLPQTPVTDINRSGVYALVLGPAFDPGSGEVVSSVSLDSQPYASIYDDGVSGGQARGRTLVGNGTVSELRPWTRVQQCNNALAEPAHVIEQDLTPSSGGTYGHLIVLVQVIPAADGSVPEDLDPLEVRVYERGTNTLVSPVMTIDLDDLDENRTLDPQIVAKEFASQFALTGGTQYYVRFETDAVAGEGSWRVQVVSDVPADVRNPPPAEFEDGAFGGGVDRYHMRSSPSQDYDGDYGALAICVQLQTQPDPPDGFAAVSSGDPSGVPCGPADYDDAVNDVDIEWTPTNLGDLFDGYEIQVFDEGSAGWETFAYITDEGCSTVTDREANIGDPSYRMRVLRTDGSPSPWTDSESVAVSMASASGGLVLSSNFDQDWALYFDTLNPSQWQPLQNRGLFQMEGRDGQISVREAADRLDQFNRTFVVYHRGATCSPLGQCDPRLGRAMFDDLLIMCGAMKDPITGRKPGLPYICVRDCNGRRWFADVNVGPVDRTEPIQYHSAQADITQLTRARYVMDASCTDAASGSGCDIGFGS